MSNIKTTKEIAEAIKQVVVALAVAQIKADPSLDINMFTCKVGGVLVGLAASNIVEALIAEEVSKQQTINLSEETCREMIENTMSVLEMAVKATPEVITRERVRMLAHDCKHLVK